MYKCLTGWKVELEDCNGEGEIQGTIATIPSFVWWLLANKDLVTLSWFCSIWW
uniref:Uncharacterized protein n=1 Tax=Nelumbo nucifera TaxID=4432 RepID=A0A822YZQ8_NELNU|nr:TPA_asm: hypothetical protein HUJ06_006886 [Nelumbo nucifera]